MSQDDWADIRTVDAISPQEVAARINVSLAIATVFLRRLKERRPNTQLAFQYDLSADMSRCTSRAIAFFPNGRHLSVTNHGGAYVVLSDNYFTLVPRESVLDLQAFLDLVERISEVKVIPEYGLPYEFNRATNSLFHELEELDRSTSAVPPVRPRPFSRAWWREIV